MYMSFHNRVILPALAVLSLAFLIGCGSSSHSTPPPSGAFSKANLSGTYVFSIVGSDNASADVQTITGSFSADGNGNIGSSGGAVDFVDSTGDSPATAVTGGSYTVNADGTGQAILDVPNPIGGTTLTLEFVLSSSSGASGGLVTQFDANGTGSGTLALQTSASQPAAGNYVIAASGVAGPGQAPLAIAGAVTIDSNGNITTGILDYNQGGNSTGPTSNPPCVVASGSVTGTTATLNLTGCPSSILLFDVYPVGSSDLKFISATTTSNQYPILSGDLFSQSSATFPSGQLVFTLGGFDPTLNASGPTAMAGLVTSDGSSTLSAGEEDYNDVGFSNITSSVSTPQPFTGTIANLPSGSSRYVLTVSNFVNVGGLPQVWAFAAYPSDNGIVLIEEDSSGGAIVGTAFAQSNTALASSTGYGMNLSGSNSGGFEEDDIAEFTTTSTGFSGEIDMNDQTASNLVTNGSLSGTYQALDATADGRGGLTSTTPDSSIDAIYYTVSSSQTVMVEVDQDQVGLGTLTTQTGSSSSSLSQSFAQKQLVVARAAAKALKARKAKENK
jgi:hypothetical protein